MWYSSPSKKNKLIYQVRANTYVFWLSGQYGKFNSNIFLFHPLGPFPSKNMRCPWILCFDLLLLQYTDLTHEIWRFLVYIFLGGPKIYSIFFLKICIEKKMFNFSDLRLGSITWKISPWKSCQVQVLGRNQNLQIGIQNLEFRIQIMLCI